MSGLRRQVALFVVLLLALSVTQPVAATGPDVLAFGGNQLRDHNSPQVAGWSLCHLWELPLGTSRSQPLLVARNYGSGQRLYMFHLGSRYLWRLDLGHPDRGPGVESWKWPEQQEQAGYLTAASIAELAARGMTIDRVLLPPEAGGPSSDADAIYSHAAYWQHPTDPTQDVVFTGTPYGEVAAIRPATMQFLGQSRMVREYGVPRSGLVAAPVILDQDTVFAAYTNGSIYVLGGFAAGRPEVLASGYFPGRLSGSPALVKDLIVLGSDRGYQNGSEIRAYQYGRDPAGKMRLQQAWVMPFPTRDNVPAGVAADSQRIYAIDGTAHIYVLNHSGMQLWSAAVSETGLSSWTNIEPAVGDTAVYFAMRHKRDDDVSQGKLVAYAKDTGEKLWEQLLDDAGNTVPVIMQHGDGGSDVLLTVDRAGNIRVRDSERRGVSTFFTMSAAASDKMPVHCADLPGYMDGDKPLYPRELATATHTLYQAPMEWDTANGAGVQPTVGYGLLAMGVNTRVPPGNPDSGQRSGTLRLYRMLPAVDMQLSSDSPATQKAQPGQVIRVAGKVKMQVTGAAPVPNGVDGKPLLPRRADVAAFWGQGPDPMQVNRVALQATADTGVYAGDLSLQVKVPDAPGKYKLWVVLNPLQTLKPVIDEDPNSLLNRDQAVPAELQPLLGLRAELRQRLLAEPLFAPNETDVSPAHQMLVIDVEVQNRQVDVTVSCDFPGDTHYSGLDAQFRVQVPGGEPVRASARLLVNTRVAAATTASLPPGTTAMTLNTGKLWPGENDVSVEVELEEAKLDPDPDNNRCGGKITGTVDQGPPPPAAPAEGRSVLVR